MLRQVLMIGKVTSMMGRSVNGAQLILIFKRSVFLPENPKLSVVWIVARDGAVSGGANETWLTTANDITFNDAGGN